MTAVLFHSQICGGKGSFCEQTRTIMEAYGYAAQNYDHRDIRRMGDSTMEYSRIAADWTNVSNPDSNPLEFVMAAYLVRVGHSKLVPSKFNNTFAEIITNHWTSMSHPCNPLSWINITSILMPNCNASQQYASPLLSQTIRRLLQN